MRCDVRTFPAHTAAVGDGSNRDFLGILTLNSNISTEKAGSADELTFKGYKTSSVERHVHVQHGAHAINHGGVDDRCGCIQITSDFWSGAVEIQNRRALLYVDFYLELYLWAF